MKKTVALVFCVLLLANTFVYGSGDEPSGWALAEVNHAIEEQLVPEELQGNYLGKIKRYEYALLALKILEVSGKEIVITENNPFSDIAGHAYEAEIIKAKNAGLIGGYPDGTFKPDKLISRQEIAKLVTNFVIAYDQGRELAISSGYDYSDTAEIGTWAMEAVNYCYHHNIMKGVGKDEAGLDQINPLGQATIEQSILLMDRLVVSEGILEKAMTEEEIREMFKDPITVISFDNEGNPVEESSDKIQDFAVTFGPKLGQVIVDLANTDECIITSIDENYMMMMFADGGRVNITNYQYGIDVNGMVIDINDNQFIDPYMKIIENFPEGEESILAINNGITAIKEGDTSFERQEDGKYFVNVYISEEDNGHSERSYVFMYKHVK